ncbi:MAG: pantoate--beta-alanine ligase [bacterium]|nr:pantoate--beta-alanine ligase [bacterium]
MNLLYNAAELKEYLNSIRMKNTIGFVPTMGALHNGHLSLIKIAKEYASNVGVSIFVNPTQFLPNEDYHQYPRTLDFDLELLRTIACDWVFIPSVQEMYPREMDLKIDIGYLGTIYEGAFRPYHFQGVATIVLKLFNLIQPDVVVFGKKDAQQCAVIRRLTKALFLDLKILYGEVIRDPSGLAISSRNRYLTEIEKERAIGLYVALQKGRAVYLDCQDTKIAQMEMINTVKTFQPTSIDYFAIVDRFTFLYPKNIQDAIAIGAIRLGTTRLIDAVDIS